MRYFCETVLPPRVPMTTTPPNAATERVIKKYPNRRLYDTSTSAYITLGEVKQLVLRFVCWSKMPKQVNLTRSILLQIIWKKKPASHVQRNRRWPTSFAFMATPAEGT